MPSIGPLEILIVSLIALIVFGPEKLPEMARTAGRALNEMRRMATEVKTEFQTGLDVDDEAPPASAKPPTNAPAPAEDETATSTPPPEA